jgi:hypothetical protein
MSQESSGSLLAALCSGLATGARSIAPIACLVPRSRHPVAGTLLTVAAAGESIADKVAPLPDRTEPIPLAGRVLLGGATGALLARSRGGSPVVATAVGAGAALAGAWFFTTARRGLTRRGVPDALVGAAEDLAVMRLTRVGAPPIPPQAPPAAHPDRTEESVSDEEAAQGEVTAVAEAPGRVLHS